MYRIFLFIFTIGSIQLFGVPAQGEALEKEMWEAMKAKNMNMIEMRISSDFQSIHEDGSRSRIEEISLIKNLDITEYTLSSMKVTEGEGLFIITYRVATNEMIMNEKLSKEPSSRLSVWKKNEAGIWQWVAHANLNPLK